MKIGTLTHVDESVVPTHHFSRNGMSLAYSSLWPTYELKADEKTILCNMASE